MQGWAQLVHCRQVWAQLVLQGFFLLPVWSTPTVVLVVVVVVVVVVVSQAMVGDLEALSP
jgi:hypothetical protein